MKSPVRVEVVGFAAGSSGGSHFVVNPQSCTFGATPTVFFKLILWYHCSHCSKNIHVCTYISVHTATWLDVHMYM